MNVWPVITRELRAQARQKYTYNLRMLGVLALLGSGIVFAFHLPFVSTFGGRLFILLHFTLFFAIWILVPLGTADCISRERREGTMGLLFLTALKPTDIVVAKGVAHGLRAVTLLVAVLPVLTIPFLIGGVSWQLAMTSVALNFGAVCWALSSALIASSRSKSSVRALVATVILAVIALRVFNHVANDPIWRVSRATTIAPLDESLRLVGISLGVLLAAIGVSALQIRSNWRDEPPPVWVQETERTFCTPIVATGFFRRWMRRKLDRNPIGWLQQRTWMGRLVTWSWFAVIASIYSAVLTDSGFFRHSNVTQQTMGWFLMGSIAASVVGSFRRERENGVLELLLVSPMATRKLIGGRLRGIWGQFLPATGILLGVWLYFVRIFRDFTDVPLMLYFLSTYLTLPVIGLYFSLASRSFIGAFLGTLAAGVLVPSIFPLGIGFLVNSAFRLQVSEDSALGYGLAILTQIMLATLFIFLLNWRLEHRSFPFNRALA